MIRKLLKIKQYGIFKDFTWTSDLKEFDKTNLFYGLNGSGKSTLSTIFDDIKNKEQRYFTGEFKIDDDEVGYFSSANLNSLDYNIYVFDSHFVEDNIGEFSNLKGIIYISESNKEAKETLESLKKERKKLLGEQTNANKIYALAQKTLDNAYISCAKRIKEEFHVIGGIANTYSNYTKITFQQAIKTYQQFLSEKHDTTEILQRIDSLKSELKDEIKEPIIFDLLKYQVNRLIASLKDARIILNKTIKSCLQEKINDSVFSWLEEGYRLHKGESHCKYCGGYISQERQQYLANLFNNEVQDLQKQISDIKNSLNDALLPEIAVSESDFYSSLRNEVSKLLDQINKFRRTINSYVQQILEKLIDKQKNPFDPIQITDDVECDIAAFQTAIEKLNTLIKSNEGITNQFNKKQLAAIKEIEKLLVYNNYVGLNISSLENDLKKATNATKNIETSIATTDNQINKYENELVDVIKASSNFNDLLSKFLGRNELNLQYDEPTKGYRIVRRDSGHNARFLSEGEKTAIAFVYFLTKVKENGNNIEESIIVIDDPISSFDSNHLFNAYAFIETYFDKSKQLFVLTHNFNFFKLLRRKYCKASMYLLESTYSTVNDIKTRNAKIKNLPKSIMNAMSEYYYLFEKIYNFHKNYSTGTEIEFDDYMQMANTCRKVIESFASFKIHNINDLSQKLSLLYKCNRPDGYVLSYKEQNECKKIYRFINSFSHNSVFEDSSETDIIFGELDSIVASILALIERADKDHYNSLLKSIT
ncbi:MAG: AAA family ATPase [Clostridiales bacterium]|nr:AAA family ATPase [Clostridiales bacterium]